MPEMRFRVRWPDGTEESCYSPSLVVRDFLVPGAAYPIADFLSRSGQALAIASERVEARYGWPCARALDQSARIAAAARRFDGQAGAEVTVLSFEA